MIGKYNSIPSDILSLLPELNNNEISEKVRDKNNAAYVDAFFSYLTSQTLHNHNFLHGIDFLWIIFSSKRKFLF